MKARIIFIIFHGVAILVLLATIAAAQTPNQPARPSPASQATDREAASAQANGREASSGMATGRRQHEPVVIVTDKSLGSGHAIESLAAPTQADKAKGGQLQNASTNPLYKDNQSAGSNPLYQSKDRQAAPKPGSSHEVVEYKDPEDMTTRYRPGNNKASKIKPTTDSTTTPQSK